MAVAGFRTVAEIHTPQVEKEEADTTVVSSGEVGAQGSAGICSEVVVVVGLEVDTDYVGAEVAVENTSSVAVENVYSAGEVAVRWRERTANWDYRQAFLARRRDHERVAVEGVVCRVVGVAVELVEMELPHIGGEF